MSEVLGDAPTQQQIEAAIASFTQLLKQQNRDRYLALFKENVKLEAENKVQVMLESSLKFFFEEIQTELQTWLRKETRFELEVQLVQNTEQSGRRFFTNKEKLDYMMEKNPELKVLKDRLQLDPDY